MLSKQSLEWNKSPVTLLEKDSTYILNGDTHERVWNNCDYVPLVTEDGQYTLLIKYE